MRFGITLGMKCCLVLFPQEATMELWKVFQGMWAEDKKIFYCVRAFWQWLLLPELSNDATIVIGI